MPITHDLYLSATLARLWGAGPNAGRPELSAWDRLRHEPPAIGQHPSPAGIAQPGQPAGAGVGRPPRQTAVEKL